VLRTGVGDRARGNLISHKTSRIPNISFLNYKMQLYIYCSGAFGKEMMDVALRLNVGFNRWESIKFVDDVFEGTERNGASVLKLDEVYKSLERTPCEFVIATGEPKGRREIADNLRARDLQLGRLIDATAIVSPSAVVHNGVLIAPLCSISSDSLLGTNSCVNTMSIVGHDVIVGEHAVISSMVNLGGRVAIGAGTYVGMGALVKEGVKIGANSVIGMGAVVYNDVPDNVIALGNPARVMRANVDMKIFK
jgi:sugar O-acyltransferase (sialic acid O-acetyltransferase NeuD family)